MMGLSVVEMATVERPFGMRESGGASSTAEQTRILIATADTVLCFALRPLLDAEGYAVSCVGADAAAALGRVTTFHPHLILIDVAEPGGWEQGILGYLRADPRHALVAAVVLVSATNPRLITRQAIGAGADDVIFKPCDRDLLVTRLVTALRAKEAVARALVKAHDADSCYRALLEFAGEAVLVVDVAGHVVQASPAAGALLGYAREELYGRALTAVLPRGIVHALQRQARTEPAEALDSGEVEAVRKDGQAIAIHMRYALVETSTGPLTYVILQRAAG